LTITMETIRQCQSHGCTLQASKHVRFGLRVWDVADNVHASEIPYTSEHLDLCDRHIKKVHENYYHVNEYEFGECPRHP
jgi:hypothetical protein